MVTVDRNGLRIQGGDILRYCSNETIDCFGYEAEHDLNYGDTVTVDTVDDDGTFTAIDWYEDGDYPFWFTGSDFEIVDDNPIDEEVFTGEVDFF